MPRTWTVTFRMPDAETRVAVAEDEYLLEAGWNAGLDLPAVCLQGWCITCAARLVSGQVDQSEALRYFGADREAGYVLLCSAYPRSDLIIETHQKQAMQAHRRAAGLPAPRG